MKLVVDSSVARNITKTACFELLDGIKKNPSCSLLSCWQWTDDWVDTVNDVNRLVYVDQIFKDFLNQWRSDMISTGRWEKDVLFNKTEQITNTELQAVCDPKDYCKLYLLRLAHEGDKVILYYSSTPYVGSCDRLSQLDHPINNGIDWRTAAQETIDWILNLL
jgi:hypothetical protein